MDLSTLIVGGFPATFDPNFRRPPTPPEFEQVKAASATGDVAAVKAIIAQWNKHSYNPELKRRFHAGLSAAIENNHVPVVSYLLRQGVDINDLDFAEATKRKLYPMLQLLLDHGWDINTPMGRIEPPALQYAIEDEELTRWFLARGARPDAKAGGLDCTALSYAVMRASFKIIKLLFDHGGSTRHGQLLQYAIYRENSDCLEVLDFLLDRGAPINDVMYQNRVQDYLMQMAFGLGTPLHKAAESGRLNVVKHLVRRRADPLIPDARRQIALELAETNGHSEVVEYLRPLSVPPSMPRQYFTDPLGFHVRNP